MSKDTLYFLQRADGLIKIGITGNLSKRVTLLVRSHGPLKVLKTVVGGRLQEVALHNKLAKHRQFGEWFAAAPEVLAAIEATQDAKDAGAVTQARKVGDDWERQFVMRAERYVKACLDARTSRLGPAQNTVRLQEIAADYGISYSALRHIREGRAKSVTAGHLEALRLAAIAEMEATLAVLQAELADEADVG